MKRPSKKDLANKLILKNIVVFIIALIIIGGIFSGVSADKNKIIKTDVSTIFTQIKNAEVKKITVENSILNVELKDGRKERAKKESGESLITQAKSYGVPESQLANIIIEVKEESGFLFWLQNLLPFIIPFLLFGGLIWMMMRQGGGAGGGAGKAFSFGQSGARETEADDKQKVTFADVAGDKEAKIELEEVVEFLKTPKKFTVIGAKIPKGVLLMGAPGTGKTLLARAVAGEANVPFFHISGSEFVEMFVGVGASRVRDLFARAKKAAPCIIFIDEIDAVGRQRGAGLGGSHDEREQTLNQILVEMDGFEPNQGTIVIAATNRPDILDSALLRPGRFDRRVVLELPDINDREEILKIHAKGKPLATDVVLRKVAERTPGFSGADLANLMNEAAIQAARRNQSEVVALDVYMSIDKVMLGPERKSKILNEKDKKLTAYHEAGHALVAHELPDSDPVHKISIISRGHAAGYTIKLPTEETRMQTKAQFKADIAVALGGFVAETIISGTERITTGASSDLGNATNIAKNLVTSFGMSQLLGPRTFGKHGDMIFLGREITEQRDYSEKTAEIIDQEISRLIEEGRKTAETIINSKRDMMEKIVAALVIKETLEQDDFEALFKA